MGDPALGSVHLLSWRFLFLSLFLFCRPDLNSNAVWDRMGTSRGQQERVRVRLMQQSALGLGSNKLLRPSRARKSPLRAFSTRLQASIEASKEASKARPEGGLEGCLAGRITSEFASPRREPARIAPLSLPSSLFLRRDPRITQQHQLGSLNLPPLSDGAGADKQADAGDTTSGQQVFGAQT